MLMILSSPSEALSFAEPKGKEASSFEKVLASTDNEWTWDITESKKVSDWTGTCCLVSEIIAVVEYVFVGTRT
jgi:hypothetical protein